MKPKAILFDLDGVLTDTAELHYLAWKRLADELGLSFDRQQNEELKGISRTESFEVILRNNGQTDRYGKEEKENMANRKNGYYRELVETLTEKDVLPGIKPLLEEARANGIRMGVASVSHNAVRVLERIGLIDRFDVIADPAKVKRLKPDPEIFLTCADQLGISPAECIGIDDAQAGVESILSAGMYAVGIHVTVTGKAPDLMLASTADLSLSVLMKNFCQKKQAAV